MPHVLGSRWGDIDLKIIPRSPGGIAGGRFFCHQGVGFVDSRSVLTFCDILIAEGCGLCAFPEIPWYFFLGKALRTVGVDFGNRGSEASVRRATALPCAIEGCGGAACGAGVRARPRTPPAGHGRDHRPAAERSHRLRAELLPDLRRRGRPQAFCGGFPKHLTWSGRSSEARGRTDGESVRERGARGAGTAVGEAVATEP